MALPLLSVIVSTYSAEGFFRGCLDDLVAQTLFDQIEVLVIDSGSPQGESAICRDYARLYPQIRLIRTEREPLYVAWNRALQFVQGKYVTNGNTDDRHSPRFAEEMVAALEANSRAALAYADQYVSSIANETFEQCERRRARRRCWPDYTPEDLLLRCITGSQPVWRKAIHESLGGFDTRYRIVADYEMWLRTATHYPLLHVPQVLGVFYDSPGTISGANNRFQVDMETVAVRRKYATHPPWAALPGLQTRLAAEWFGRGYQHIEKKGDGCSAKPLIQAAMAYDRSNLRYLKTYLLRCLFAGRPKDLGGA